MTQAALGHVPAPGQDGPPQQSMEKPGVEVLEDLFQIIVEALRPEYSLATARLPNRLGLPHHDIARGEPAVTHGVPGVERLAVELGEEDMGNGAQDALRSPFKHVREM